MPIDNNEDFEFDLQAVAARREHRRKTKKRRLIRRIVNVFGSLILAMSLLTTTAMGAYLFYSGKVINQQTTSSETGKFPPVPVSTHSGVSYVLVLGVDPDEKLTDIMIVACIDHEKKTLSFLQIPRDLYIGDDMPNYRINSVYSNPREGESKINALRRRLGSYLGIPIDHYVLFTIKGFISVIDAVGGISINIEQPTGVDVKDYITNVHHRIGPGWVDLKGSLATGFVRKRFGEKDGYKKGDIDRIEAQRIVYVALAKKLQNMTFMQMISIARNCYSQVYTDMTLDDIGGYANEVKKIPLASMCVYAIPGQPVDGYKGQSLYSIHRDDYVTMFNAHFNPYGEKITEASLSIKELHTKLGLAKTGNYVDDGGTLSDLMQKENQSISSQGKN